MVIFHKRSMRDEIPPQPCPKCESKEHDLLPVAKGGKYVMNGMVVRKCKQCGASNADAIRMADYRRYGKEHL